MDGNIEFRMLDGETVPGSHPLIIIGPNGAGKTRLGASLAERNHAEWIGALRNLYMKREIGRITVDNARKSLQQTIETTRRSPYVLADDLHFLLSQLLAEDEESALAYRDFCRKNQGEPPPETAKYRVLRFWHKHFPDRTLDLSYSFKVTSNRGASSVTYPFTEMSDGERVAFYLAARVISAPDGLIIVDEPEVHFHSALARRIWNGLETIRPECRFVYITHDLPFALSRRSAQFIIAQSSSEGRVLPRDAGIPAHLIESILGAASFSVTARRIVFCEGTTGSDMDEAIYQAWFQDIDTAVLPVGGCGDVVKCVEVFNSSPAIRGGNAIGIVDRDYWPDSYLDSLPQGIHVLNVHEVESLLCLPAVFNAVAGHHEQKDVSVRYNRFLDKARNCFVGPACHKQVLERAKRRVEISVAALLNRVSPGISMGEVRSQFLNALECRNWGFDAGKMFDEEETVVKAALHGTAESFLRVLPGKTYFSHAADALGVKSDEYVRLVTQALSLPADEEGRSGLAKLKQELVAALEKHLPPRKCEPK